MTPGRPEIEREIAELTRRRAERAPDFERLLARPPRAGRRGVARGWVWAGAVATIVLGVVLWRVPFGPPPPPDRAELRAIAEWRAPTDVLLPSFDRSWLSGPPPLGRAGLIVYTAGSSADLEIPTLEEEHP